MQSLQRSRSKSRLTTLNIQPLALPNIKENSTLGNNKRESTSIVKDPKENKENENGSFPSSSSSSRKSSKHIQTALLLSPLATNLSKSNSKGLPSPKSPKVHMFQKKTFSKPTWCQISNKFIWGLNKSGYECMVCGFAVSRKHISQAKNLNCGQGDGLVDISTERAVTQLTKTRVFTIYLPHGAKKTVFLNPREPLRNVLEKICIERGLSLNEFVPEDTAGDAIDFDTLLGNINGAEITFTKREPEQSLSQAASTPNLPLIPLVSPRERKSKASKKTTNSRGHKSQVMDTKDLPSPRDMKPRKVIEMFDIGEELGSGAFSIVKSAVHKETHEQVAIKILDKHEDDDEQTRKFKQEIQIISNLHHENIVKFYELDEDDEYFYVVMEIVGGGELFDYIIDNGALKEHETACIIGQVLKAVEYMHGLGIAHRDLKPENLLFKDGEHKVIKITDFGESKSFSHGPLTTYCGTPDYMSPEIIRGEPYGSAADIWAIGVITYVMLAGFPPFDGENDVEVFASILSVKYDFPSPEWDGISSEAKNFVKLILNEDVIQRQTATECLNHPWIVNQVPEELRKNIHVLPDASGGGGGVGGIGGIGGVVGGLGASSSRLEESKQGKVSEVEEKKKLMESLEELKKAVEGTVYEGEVTAMENILEASSKYLSQPSQSNPLLTLKTNYMITTAMTNCIEMERVIVQNYQKRVKEITGLLKKNKRGRKK